MAPVGDRHSGDLDHQLAPFDQTRTAVVRVEVDEAIADFASTQHTAWMVVCLLARLDGVVSQVQLAVPSVPLVSHVIPFGEGGGLDERLLSAGNAIDQRRFVRHDGGEADRVIRIGSPVSGSDVAVLGAGWWCGVSLDGAVVDWRKADLASTVPFGPYLAACFAVGDVYLRARGLPRRGNAVFGWDSFGGGPALTPTVNPPIAIDLTEAALAGVGAVGTTWMHAMWSYPDATGTVVVVDADKEGVDETNLNRGVLFIRSDIASPKAATAASRVVRGGLRWDPRLGRFEEIADVRPALLVSAVDSNTARHAIQGLYSARIVGASTLDLRAEVLSIGEPGVGCCLRCFLELEPRLSDETTHARARADLATVEQVAHELDVDAGDAAAWLRDPTCGQITPDLTERLRDLLGDSDLPQFSVGFVSVAAGVLLAAETVKILAGLDEPMAASSSLRVQFWDPGSNKPRRPMLRQVDCPRCNLPEAGLEMWRSRRRAFDATRGNKMLRG